jgi:hypothetical protein
MKKRWMFAASLGLLVHAPAYAIDAKYAAKLERSGCTQISELQGCDLNKTREENAKAGFGPGAAADAASESPLAGNWIAVGPSGATVAEIHIDGAETVWVGGNQVKAARSGGALMFTQGVITYSLQVDRSSKGKDTWSDADAGSTGPIVAE